MAETFRSDIPRIFLDSFLTFSSSEEYPSSFKDPAHGTTFRARGAGNGPLSLIRVRISPAISPTELPATALI